MGDGEGLVLRPCKAVHSLGMKFAIDVVYVRWDGVVLHVLTMPPGRLGPFVGRASWVLELPAGKLAETGTARGDRILLSYPG